MSRTLDALNQLEQRRPDSTGMVRLGNRLQGRRGLNKLAFLPKAWCGHRHKLLILMCLIVAVGAAFIFIVRLPSFQSEMTVGSDSTLQHNPSTTHQTTAPLPEIGGTAELTLHRTVPSGVKPLSGKGASMADNANDSNTGNVTISDTQEAIQRWYGDGLTLQAIVWSREPSARKVLINNKMVYQGQTIEGYQLAVIGKESIVLSRGEKLWRLLLGR